MSDFNERYRQEVAGIRPKDPTALDLLKVLVKRGNPATARDLDPRIGTFEELRSMSEWTGEIYPQQITMLKRGAMLIGDSHVTIGIDRDNRDVTFTFNQPLTEPERIERLKQMVAAVLGSGWCVKMLDDDSGKLGSSRKAAKPKRARSNQKGRKRRKPAKP